MVYGMCPSEPVTTHVYITRVYVHRCLWYAVCSGEALTQDQRGIGNSTRCADRGLTNNLFISGGVVCYNGTTIGSIAVYICNDGFVLLEGDEATRVCQSDANWNGSIPQCTPEEPGMYSSSLLNEAFTYIPLLYHHFNFIHIHASSRVVLRLQWKLLSSFKKPHPALFHFLILSDIG